MISRDEFYMGVARLAAQRSTCTRGHVGAVAVLDRRVIATGYNGAPPRGDHCTDVGCLVPDPELGCQRAVHAEANLIAFAARHGVPLEGAVLYTTHGPCLKCAQLIVSSGISSVIWEIPYRLPDGLDMLVNLDVAVRMYGDPTTADFAGRALLSPDEYTQWCHAAIREEDE